jgi:holo-[acyl-carrier protein] synthase
MTAPVLGVGTDLVEVDRLRSALERQPGLADRLFTASEQAALVRHRDPLPHLAARFAAKESVMKALGRGMGSMAFTDIEVVSEESGAPRVVLHGRAREWAQELGVGTWHLSLTHTASLAQAVAIAGPGV